MAEEYRKAADGLTDDEVFGRVLPEFAALAAMESTSSRYDTLVLDEAQDILSTDMLETLSAELLDGFERGRWRVFLDSNNQASVFDALDSNILDFLARTSERSINLSINCRNTKQIALQTSIVAEPRTRAAALVSGVPVDFKAYRSERQCLDGLKSVVDALLEEGVPHGRISILLVRSPTEPLRATLAELPARRLCEEDVRDLGGLRLVDLTWSTVSAFKGLENDVVVLVGVEDIQKDWWRGVTYVGMSRARARLVVLVNARCDGVRQKRLEVEMAKRLDEGEMIA